MASDLEALGLGMPAVHRPVVIEPEVWVGHFGKVDIEAPPLTEAEVAELAEGALVTVIWSGGNGPHDYEIAVDARGQRYAWTGRCESVPFYNPLRFIGQERFHTRVWLR